MAGWWSGSCGIIQGPGLTEALPSKAPLGVNKQLAERELLTG